MCRVSLVACRCGVLLFVGCCSLLVVRCLLFVGVWLLCVGCCLLVIDVVDNCSVVDVCFLFYF